MTLALRMRWALLVHRLKFYGDPDEGGLPAVIRVVGETLYRVPRYLGGARRVPLAPDLRDTAGSIDERHLRISWGGACPVQGEGELYGLPIYYRSRGEGWELSVAGYDGDPLGDDAWVHYERRYFWPDGGWLHHAVSEGNIRRAAWEYERAHPQVAIAWRAAHGGGA